MAITASYAERNSVVELTKNNAAATFSVDFSDKPAEKVIILVENNNQTASCTATLQVSPGDFLGNAVGTLSVDVAAQKTGIVGPIESVRYKNTASEIDCALAVTGSSDGGTLTNVKVSVIKLP